MPTQRKLHVDNNYRVLPTQRKLHVDDNYRVLPTQRKLHVFCSVPCFYPFQVARPFAARFKLCIVSFV